MWQEFKSELIKYDLVSTIIQLYLDQTKINTYLIKTNKEKWKYTAAALYNFEFKKNN